MPSIEELTRAARAIEVIEQEFRATAEEWGAGWVEFQRQGNCVVWCVARWAMDRAQFITAECRREIGDRCMAAPRNAATWGSVAGEDDTLGQLGPAVAFRFELM